MDYQIVWSPEAIEDIEDIAEYIARDSENYARAVVTNILALARSIVDHPLLGRVVPEIGDSQIRERLIYSYRLVYRLEQNHILIIAVIHGKRMMDNRFDDDPLNKG